MKGNGSLDTETGDIYGAINTAMSPSVKQNKQTTAGTPKITTSTPELSKKSLGRPTIQALLFKEKSTNSSILNFCSSPSIKRSAADNDNLDNLNNRQTKKITALDFDLSSKSPEIFHTPRVSPETSPSESIPELNTTMTAETPSPLFEFAPSLDDEGINPKLGDFLKFMLQEQRTSTEKILNAQRETAARLDTLEKTVHSNRAEQIQDAQVIKTRLSDVEEQTTSNKQSSEVVKELVKKLEIQDKAARQNNIVMKGLSFHVKELKGRIAEFLSEFFNYSGQIINVKPLGRDRSNNDIVNIVAVTLHSFESKLNILRNKKTLDKRSTVTIQADRTEAEREGANKLWKFAREQQPDGTGIQYTYQKIYVKGSWYKWDSYKKVVVQCNSPRKKEQVAANLSVSVTSQHPSDTNTQKSKVISGN